VRRIEIVLGKTLANVLAAEIATLVVGAVREDVDLDYKGQLYGNSDADRRDLAGYVAAMANTVGGVIALGVEEADGAAATARADYTIFRARDRLTGLLMPVATSRRLDAGRREIPTGQALPDFARMGEPPKSTGRELSDRRRPLTACSPFL